MKLLHYSKEPLGALRSVSVEQQEKNERGLFKPLGLWVSVEGEDDWLSWCKAESFGLERLSYVTEIVLRPTANILRLHGAADIDRFHAQYKEEGPHLSWRRYVSWPRVVRDYDGIIIAPYVWSRRLDGEAGWYYSWDCASGCIWNADAIYALASVKNPEPETV